MARRTVTIASSVGLHARPASIFVQAATATGLPVTIAKSGEAPVDARSILAVMALGAGDVAEAEATGKVETYQIVGTPVKDEPQKEAQ